MEDDWDLTAVVRGCSTAISTTKPTTTLTSSHHFHSSCSPFLSSFASQQGFVSNNNSSQPFPVLPLSPTTTPDPIKPTSAIQELHDLYKPFFPKSHHTPSSLLTQPPQITPQQPNFSASQPLHRHQQHQPNKLSATNTTQRSKKRKNLLKKVCQVPAESLSSDVWAWRKYGQKPIKGSPYPRGYYRCSSSKGCMARKQVERNRSNPGMFIVTYTAEHNHPAPTHRNSLAGSTRHKSVSSPQSGSVTGGGGDDSAKPKNGGSPSPETSAEEGGRSITTTMEAKDEKQSPLADEVVDETEYFGACDTIVTDDFFVGLDGLAGDYFSDHSTASFGGPWSAATAASSI